MITTQDIIRDIAYYARRLWSKKWWIVAIAVVATTVHAISVKTSKPEYMASKTFMVSDDDGGGGIGLSAVLGQFGLGDVGGGNYNYKKIIQIAVSNLILDRVLYSEVELNGKSDLIGNHIINEYGLHEQWQKDSSMREFHFSTINENSKPHPSVRKILEGKLRGNRLKPGSPRLVDIFYDMESSILSIQVGTVNPKLSIEIAEAWYNELSKFYIEKKIERQKATYDQLEAKADSVYQLLSQTEKDLAKSMDWSSGMISQLDRLPQARSMRNLEIYSTMYSEVLKNKETAQFILSSQTPFFQAIDSPSLPLYNSKRFSLITGLITFFITTILASAVFLVLAYYRKEIQPLVQEARE